MKNKITLNAITGTFDAAILFVENRSQARSPRPSASDLEISTGEQGIDAVK